MTCNNAEQFTAVPQVINPSEPGSQCAAESAAVAWRALATTLAPVIGQPGTMALYRHSLTPACVRHPWLAAALERADWLNDFTALRAVLAHRSVAEIVTVNRALIKAFSLNLNGLIGETLAEQLLQSARKPLHSGLTLRRGVTDRRMETRAAQLLQANERLMTAALAAQVAADKTAESLRALQYSSQRDPLTNTPNRTLMLDRLNSAIALARRRRGRLAVMFLDIDSFKLINDVYGHALGDNVVRLFARRLESAVRDSDTVSRHGGDEFLVLLPDVTDAFDACMFASKILDALAMPYPLEGCGLSMSASIGISIFPEHGEDAHQLISRADAAMYRVKKGGGGRFGLHQLKGSV